MHNSGSSNGHGASPTHLLSAHPWTISSGRACITFLVLGEPKMCGNGGGGLANAYVA